MGFDVGRVGGRGRGSETEDTNADDENRQEDHESHVQDSLETVGITASISFQVKDKEPPIESDDSSENSDASPSLRFVVFK